MVKHPYLIQEERAVVAEIQQLLLDCFSEHQDAIVKGEKNRARRLEEEIEDLKREKKSVEEMAYSRLRPAF
jgi:Na+/phosphate symporter